MNNLTYMDDDAYLQGYMDYLGGNGHGDGGVSGFFELEYETTFVEDEETFILRYDMKAFKIRNFHHVR